MASLLRELQLIGRRDVRSINSWLHNLPSLVKGKDRSTLQVSPADAERLGITDGCKAEVKSRVGSIEVPVEKSDRLALGVVSLPHGWGTISPARELVVASRRPGVNANLVVDDREMDRPSGTSVLNGVPLEISRVD